MDEPKPAKEHHGREYAVTSIGAIAEYLALRYGIGWLAWLAALLLWLAFVEFTKKRLSTKRHWKYGLWAATAVVMAVITYCLVREKSVSAEAKATTTSQQTPTSASQETIGPQSPNSVQVGGSVNQNGKGNCSPNIIGGKTIINCGPVTMSTLKPAHLPDPPMPSGVASALQSLQEMNKKWGANISVPIDSPDALKLYLGSSIGFTTKQDQIVLQVGGKDLLVIHRSSSGITIDAKIFDADGKIVAGIERNVFRPNPNNVYYVDNPDPSTLTVHDQRDEVVLKLKYLNPKSMIVTGIFYYGGRDPVTITDSTITWEGGNKRIKGSLLGDNASGLISIP